MIRALFILVLLSAPIAAQDIRVIERLADGSFIVAIDSVEFRALPPAKVAELAKQKIDLEGAQKINLELNVQIKEALLQRDLAQARKDLVQQKAESFEKDFNRTREDAARFQSLFMSERDLRIEASQFVPHGNRTKLDKVLAFFDRPATVSFFKIGLPLIQTWRCQ